MYNVQIQTAWIAQVSQCVYLVKIDSQSRVACVNLVMTLIVSSVKTKHSALSATKVITQIPQDNVRNVLTTVLAAHPHQTALSVLTANLR